jgi:hypothetical protein
VEDEEALQAGTLLRLLPGSQEEKMFGKSLYCFWSVRNMKMGTYGSFKNNRACLMEDSLFNAHTFAQACFKIEFAIFSEKNSFIYFWRFDNWLSHQPPVKFRFVFRKIKIFGEFCCAKFCAK